MSTRFCPRAGFVIICFITSVELILDFVTSGAEPGSSFGLSVPLRLSLYITQKCKGSVLHIFPFTFSPEDQGSALMFSRWNTSTFDRRIFHSGRCWKAVFPEQLSHSAEPRGPLWTPAKLGGDSRTVAGALSPYSNKSESVTMLFREDWMDNTIKTVQKNICTSFKFANFCEAGEQHQHHLWFPVSHWTCRGCHCLTVLDSKWDWRPRISCCEMIHIALKEQKLAFLLAPESVM